MKRLVIIVLVLLSTNSFGQTVQQLIDKVDLNNLELTVSEFSGEQSTTVNGTNVTILNRQHGNNDLAAQYIKEKFLALDNMTVSEQDFNTTGKNIIAIQEGLTNPNDIYLVCAHYDTMADYCADDNATGTAAVIEIARILSEQCLDNTIVYALWDEEEIGLRGSKFYAQNAAANNQNILGVINLDMMGYDSDADGEPGENTFDIDVRDLHGSLIIKDDLLTLLNTYTFNLNVEVVNPGTTASDHAQFWNNGYPAVLVGESWETNDETPYYHSSGDRLSTIDMPYFTEMTKLVMGYMATKGGLVAVDNTVVISETILAANQDMAAYQWFNCDTNTLIVGETNQTFSPINVGNYAVEVTVGSCIEMSNCVAFTTLGVEIPETNYFTILPNSVKSVITIESTLNETFSINIFNVSGQKMLETSSNKNRTDLDLSAYASGIYYVKVKGNKGASTFRVLKD